MKKATTPDSTFPEPLRFAREAVLEIDESTVAAVMRKIEQSKKELIGNGSNPRNPLSYPARTPFQLKMAA